MENKIKEIRAKRKLTAQELADRSGVNVNTINFLENGRLDIYNTKLETLCKLSGALHVSIFALLGVKNSNELKYKIKLLQ